jgi:hypothetical protein
MAQPKLQHKFSAYGTAPANFKCRNHLKVAGIQNYYGAALRFALGAVDCDQNSERHGLDLEREPENSYDPNAIKVIGWWRTSRVHIGYVPKDYAGFYAKIADKGHAILAVLKSAYIGEADNLSLEFVIYGMGD